MSDHTHPRLAPLQTSTIQYKPEDEVDFIVVGSGAAGGVVAKELSTAGFRVVVLEQGPWRSEKDFVHDEIAIFQQGALTNDFSKSPNTFRKTEKEKAKNQPCLAYGRGVLYKIYATRALRAAGTTRTGFLTHTETRPYPIVEAYKHL